MMDGDNGGIKIDEKLEVLETQVRHLKNELFVMQEEYKDSIEQYYEILNDMEDKVKERSGEVFKLNKLYEVKTRELQLMIDSSPEMIYYKDDRGRFIRINKKFAQTVGLPFTSIIGKTYKEIFPKEENQTLHDDSPVLNSGKSQLMRTELLNTVKGSIPVLIDKIPYKDINGKTIGIIGFALNLSDFNKIEDDKKVIEERLARAEKMEAIALMAGGIAHDTNNILGGITGYIQLALMDLEEDHPAVENLDDALKSVNQMAELIQDLLSLANMGIQNDSLININDVISDYFNSKEHKNLRIVHPEIKFETHLTRNVMNIRGNRERLRKVIINTVGQAIDSIHRSGRLSIATINTHIDKPIMGYDLRISEGDFVVIQITDNGVGFTEKELNHIFDPFYMRQNQVKNQNGLSLANVYGIIKDHKGYIDVKSDPDSGTEFSFYFPVTRDVPREDKKPSVTLNDIRGNGERVLIVDDITSQQEIASGILRKLGYNPVAVSTGEEAVSFLQNNDVDILILDMVLATEMDGLKTYKEVLTFKPEQRAVIASGFTESEKVQECLNLGASAFIQKPYTVETLGKVIKKGLE